MRIAQGAHHYSGSHAAFFKSTLISTRYTLQNYKISQSGSSKRHWSFVSMVPIPAGRGIVATRLKESRIFGFSGIQGGGVPRLLNRSVIPHLETTACVTWSVVSWEVTDIANVLYTLYVQPHLYETFQIVRGHPTLIRGKPLLGSCLLAWLNSMRQHYVTNIKYLIGTCIPEALLKCFIQREPKKPWQLCGAMLPASSGQYIVLNFWPAGMFI